jgi:hypothetical protein
MSDSSQQPPAYEPGQVVNGHVWTGTQWLPVAQPPPPRPPGISTLRIVGAVVAFVTAAFSALLGVSWLAGYNEIQSQGNEFAGLLVLLGMGALGFAVAFALGGVAFLVKKP